MGSVVGVGMSKFAGSNATGWLSSMSWAITISEKFEDVKGSSGKNAGASLVDVVGVVIFASLNLVQRTLSIEYMWFILWDVLSVMPYHFVIVCWVNCRLYRGSDSCRSYVGYVGAGTELKCDWASSWVGIWCGGDGVIGSPVPSNSFHATENCGWSCRTTFVEASWASACSERNISHQCSSQVPPPLPWSNQHSLSLLFSVSRNLDMPILELVGFARPE